TAIGDDWDIEERCTAQLARLGLDVTLDRAARRAGTAARNVKDAGLPKIVAGKLKRDAQESAARADEVHARRVGDARARLDAAEQAVRDDDTVVLDLPDTAVPAGRTVLSATGLNIRRDGQMLFAGNGIDVDIRGPERIALTGRNGAGKSTLLRMINGDLSPDAGHVTKSDGRIAYLSQRLDLLDEQRSVLENLTAWTPTLGITRRMHLLAQFLFQGNRIELPAAALSGGERLRATLACVLYAEPAPHLLLLDEPTNNLDLVSVAQLESALNAYRGAFIVVSHDDRFLDAIGIERRMTLPETPALSAPAGSAI
ncbi:MAG: ATP-binding cassette domain-containing protein, partial [Mycobacterium sp.]|nr:ATP-binding cassette domain-containing protein [Mycobacterium sp.]